MKLLIFLILVGISSSTYSQTFDSLTATISQLTDNYLLKINSKISSVDNNISKQTEKYIKKLQRQEDKIKRQLYKIDSTAQAGFIKAKQKYSELSKKIKSKAVPITTRIDKLTGSQYDSYLDSLGTTLNFINQFKEVAMKVKEPLKNLEQLKDKLQQTDQIKKYITERKEQIKQMLSKFTNVPKSLQKDFGKLSKTAYYYSAQIKEYKEILRDPKKIEQKALSLLNKLPAFQKFMKENSELASLFQNIGSNGSGPDLAGLQTRASMQTMIARQISMGGQDARAQVQQSLAMAHAQINNLKDKINKLGGGSSPDCYQDEMPDFKPNEQKTKSFLKRMEFGTNFQLQKADRFFPSTSDIGLSVGYKLNDKSILGIGASYKIGWGKGFRDIHITSQGVGLRSFVDYKIKKSFFISGGYEQNYKTAFNSIDQLKDHDAWQTSGLIGITKKYKIPKKIKGNMQLLWDFMSYNQIPRTQPVIYRLGYMLK